MFPSREAISEVTVEAKPGRSGPVTTSVASSSRAVMSVYISGRSSASGREVIYPFGCVQQSTERVAVDLDRIVCWSAGDRGCQLREEPIGASGSNEIGQREAVLLDDRPTCSHSESSCIAEQSFDSSWSRRPDANKTVNPVGPSLGDPVPYPVGVESELCENHAVESLLFQRPDLGHHM